MACVHALVRRLLHCTEQIFPICFCFIAHLSKTVDVVIFSFVRVHLKHLATFSPCDRWPLPRKCSSSLSRQHACVSLTVEMGAHRPSLQSESRCSLHGNGRVRNRLSRKHLSIALMQTWLDREVVDTWGDRLVVNCDLRCSAPWFSCSRTCSQQPPVFLYRPPWPPPGGH